MSAAAEVERERSTLVETWDEVRVGLCFEIAASPELGPWVAAVDALQEMAG